MNKELENKLYEKYPEIFRDRTKDKMETCMCWGICCGDGWFDLLNDMCATLQFNTKMNRYPQVVADQVKEKFGTLCFYYHTEDTKESATDSIGGSITEFNKGRAIGYISGIVSFAEKISGKICENCGSNHNVTQTKGWTKYLCDRCINGKNNQG